ncbi:4338_t:CDS:1, partial [Scutellospora calospora]
FSNELASQVSCYGLPYGFFGIICWSLSLCCIALAKVRFPLFSPWLWFKPYKAQHPLMAIIVTIMTVGPTIYTCIHCHGELMIVLIAIGQLTPWSLKFVYDAWFENNDLLNNVNDNYQPNNVINQSKTAIIYSYIGSYLGLLLSASGWVGLTGIIIKLIKLESIVGQWIFLIYSGPLLLLTLLYFCSNYRGGITFYLFLSIHIIGSHMILALVSNNWSGINFSHIEMDFAIAFFIGKRLLFVDLPNHFFL